jgi:hypothetical protein
VTSQQVVLRKPVRRPLSRGKENEAMKIKSQSPIRKPQSPVKKPETPVRKPVTPVRKPATPLRSPAAAPSAEEDTPTRRSRRRSGDRTQELTQILGNQSVTCRVGPAVPAPGPWLTPGPQVTGCTDGRVFALFDYGKHFSQTHRDSTPLHDLLVENEKGVEVRVAVYI